MRLSTKKDKKNECNECGKQHQQLIVFQSEFVCFDCLVLSIKLLNPNLKVYFECGDYLFTEEGFIKRKI